MIRAELDGKATTGELDPRGGHWFEKVVASTLVAAGANAVRVGVKVAWPAGARPETPEGRSEFKDDADVIARFGHRFVVVECKLGRSTTLASAARKVEAVASRAIGRLAIPLVVRPQIRRTLVEERLRVKQGAAFLDLAHLADPSGLLGTLQQIWAARRMLGEA
jgi:Holliday junction resolvase